MASYCAILANKHLRCPWGVLYLLVCVDYWHVPPSSCLMARPWCSVLSTSFFPGFPVSSSCGSGYGRAWLEFIYNPVPSCSSKGLGRLVSNWSTSIEIFHLTLKLFGLLFTVDQYSPLCLIILMCSGDRRLYCFCISESGPRGYTFISNYLGRLAAEGWRHFGLCLLIADWVVTFSFSPNLYFFVLFGFGGSWILLCCAKREDYAFLLMRLSTRLLYMLIAAVYDRGGK